MTVVRLRDLQDAEAKLDLALSALQNYMCTPSAWPGHERLDDRDQRVLVLYEHHFERVEDLRRAVRTAESHLRDLQAQFAGVQ